MKSMEPSDVIGFWEEYLREREEQDYLTLYFMVPFCVQKCDYCIYFIRPLTNPGQLEECVGALERQVRLLAPIFRGVPIRATGFGGGSPSLLSAGQLSRLLGLVETSFELEVGDQNMHTFEISPDSINREKLEILDGSFVNRIGVGVQSLDEGVLRAENRPVIPRRKIIDTLAYVRDHFRACNVDLIYRLESMTDEIARADVDTVLELGVQMVTVNRLRRRPVEHLERDLFRFLSGVSHPRYRLAPTDKRSPAPRLIRRDMTPFRYVYNPEPIDWNNVLGFGEHSQSIVIPGRRSYFLRNGSDGRSQYLLYEEGEKNAFSGREDLEQVRQQGLFPEEMAY